MFPLDLLNRRSLEQFIPKLWIVCNIRRRCSRLVASVICRSIADILLAMRPMNGVGMPV